MAGNLLEGVAVIDLVLAHPQWRGHIDATQIGGFGASMGGETMMLLGGAGLTSSLPGLSWNQVTLDPRIKASVGYVPHGASHRCERCRGFARERAWC